MSWSLTAFCCFFSGMNPRINATEEIRFCIFVGKGSMHISLRLSNELWTFPANGLTENRDFIVLSL